MREAAKAARSSGQPQRSCGGTALTTPRMTGVQILAVCPKVLWTPDGNDTLLQINLTKQIVFNGRVFLRGTTAFIHQKYLNQNTAKNCVIKLPDLSTLTPETKTTALIDEKY